MATGTTASTRNGGVRLVVVESPSKAKTISGYLGDGYVVESSVGHIRDLPRGAADVPAKYKGEPWARLGVNTENGFEPLYVVSPEKKAQVAKLKSLLAGADELYLATDEDREGEAIAWHLLETLKPKIPVKRMVFHEITPAAILEAAANPRALDENLVDAQETRRILDRLYGYEVSPVLWKKVMPKLSAGRVQSVATRIIVQRERERMAFRSGAYWGLDALMAPVGADGRDQFKSALNTVDGRRLAAGRDFDPATGGLRAGSDVLLLDEDGARALAAALAGGTGIVTSVEEKPYTAQALSAVHDVHAAAGGGPQARLQFRAHHAYRAAAVRERLHHLHADRLHDAEFLRAAGGPRAGQGVVRAGVRARRAPPVHAEGQERPGGARGDPPRGRPIPHARPGRGRPVGR